MRGVVPPFIQLDYLYVPSADVAKDLEYFTGVLGAELAFAVGWVCPIQSNRSADGLPGSGATDSDA